MITPSQFRAAKALLNWSFEDLENHTGLSKMALQNIANGKARPRNTTIEKLTNTFQNNGVEIIQGGARWTQDIVTIYEGEDCYIRLLDEIIREKPKEVLFSGADERRSTKESMKRLTSIRTLNIKMRSLIKNKDTHIMGHPEEYRWMPDNLFVDGDVKVMHENTISYLMSWLGTPRVIKITDKNIAQENLRIFNHIWDNAKGPQKSTSELKYD